MGEVSLGTAGIQAVVGLAGLGAQGPATKFGPSAQKKAALRSLFKLKDAAKLEMVELTLGPTAPRGKEGRWNKTTPGKGWFVCFRIYGPEKPAFDGSWKPGDFEVVG